MQKLVRELPAACPLTHASRIEIQDPIDSEPAKDWKEALKRINGSMYLVEIASCGSFNDVEEWEAQILDGNEDYYRWRARKYEDVGGLEAAVMEVYSQFHDGKLGSAFLTEKGCQIVGAHLMGMCECKDPLEIDDRYGEIWQCVNDRGFPDLVAHIAVAKSEARKTQMIKLEAEKTAVQKSVKQTKSAEA